MQWNREKKSEARIFATEIGFVYVSFCADKVFECYFTAANIGRAIVSGWLKR